MSQYDPSLHARRLASNRPPEGWDQDYLAPQPPPQQPLYYTPGQYHYLPVQPPRQPWSRRHPFLFWLGVVATGLIVSAVIVWATGSGSTALGAYL